MLGVQGIPIPYGAPNASPYVERFMGTLRRECLDHFVFFSEAQLRRTVNEFVAYDNGGRPNQGPWGPRRNNSCIRPPIHPA